MAVSYNFFNEIKTSTQVGVFGLTNYMKANYIFECYKKLENNILVVVDDNSDVNNLYNMLILLTKNILTFPMDSIVFENSDAISPEFMQERFDTLSKLMTNENYIVIASLEGYLHNLINFDKYGSEIIEISVGNEISFSILENFLVENLYERVSMVSQTGEFSFRGHILDIYLENTDNPIRIEFWGDEVESIRKFDLVTQRSIENIESATIFPNADCYKDETNFSTINEYVNGYNIVVDYNRINSRYLNSNNFSNVFNKSNFNCFLVGVDTDINLNVEKVFYRSEVIDSFNNNFEYLRNFVTYKLKDNYLVVISLDSRNQVETIISNLKIDYKIVSSEDELDYSKLNIVISHVAESVDFSDRKICIINSYTIFNKTIVYKKYSNKFKFSQKIRDIEELQKGNYIVHEKHGIGRYEGIKTIVSQAGNGEISNDFFEVSYKKGDRLYVPIEQINLIQKYSSDSTYEPKINTLGGVEWEKTKRKIRGRMEEMAQKLLDIYAKRNSVSGFACSEDSVDALVFENEFEFEPTRDQIKAINEIKIDMESNTPMDRLLCGDVGFGKTEVAFRAAYKAMDNSKQVAYLCPTTVLSIQQYENALKRFSNVPINIAILNRFTTSKKKEEVYQKLKSGHIDFIIGTHSLLNSNIEYKDLGLLIVDEEQRFGVEHKEKIKEIKVNVDVLTLTATPIPRTLQMSLLGIRGLSVIETAPINRFPIQTYVIEYSDEVVFEAIKKEVSRSGQVFILCNMISSQNKIKKLIENKLENVRAEVVNSKMTKEQIEEVFFNFNNNEFNVLIATTIIETGIDIANANTLIVLDADKFGLSQLYQIRGRVGRSDNIAYAYLTYNASKALTTTAIARLEAIKNFTSLGSGFKIASRDLSIRGAGDVLGAEQTGFIDTVGFDLYMKMLKDVIDTKKGEASIDIVNRLPLTAYSNHIPSEYVSNDDLKLAIHKKIQTITDDESYSIVYEEISDIYGKIPNKVEEYMKDVLFNVKINNFGLKKIEEKKLLITLEFTRNNIDGIKLLEAATKVGRQVRLVNKMSKIYVIIDRGKTSCWKDDLLELINIYDMDVK
ncbi:MAG: transcription-repair coupling factor [Bacilli bacterium]